MYMYMHTYTHIHTHKVFHVKLFGLMAAGRCQRGPRRAWAGNNDNSYNDTNNHHSNNNNDDNEFVAMIIIRIHINDNDTSLNYRIGPSVLVLSTNT